MTVDPGDAARIGRETPRLVGWAEQLAERDFPIGAGDDLLEAAAIGLRLGAGPLTKAKAALRCQPPKVRLYERPRPECERCGGSGWIEDDRNLARRCHHEEAPAA